MRIEREIKRRIAELEAEAMKRIREGKVSMKFEIVYQLKALRWVLEEDKGEEIEDKKGWFPKDKEV